MANSLNRQKQNKGFSLIELLVVILIIGILSAIILPAYIGIRDRSRVASMKASARGAQGELSFWLQAASTKSDKTEVDTDFNGTIGAGDKTDEELYNDGVALTYAGGRNIYLKEKSPWDANLPLWNSDNTNPSGRISLIPINANEIRVTGKSGSGETIVDIIVSSD